MDFTRNDTPRNVAEKMRQNALLRGRALDEEPRVRHTCNMGVGCEDYGICYAEAHGEPDRCGRATPLRAKV